MEGAALPTIACLVVSIPHCTYPTNAHLLLLSRPVGPVDCWAALALMAEPSACRAQVLCQVVLRYRLIRPKYPPLKSPLVKSDFQNTVFSNFQNAPYNLIFE